MPLCPLRGTRPTAAANVSVMQMYSLAVPSFFLTICYSVTAVKSCVRSKAVHV